MSSENINNKNTQVQGNPSEVSNDNAQNNNAHTSRAANFFKPKRPMR